MDGIVVENRSSEPEKDEKEEEEAEAGDENCRRGRFKSRRNLLA
jgi:hypothetical protein